MKEFLDLKGESGAAYRFRLAPDLSKLPGMSGNFVCVRWAGDEPEIVCVGTAGSLGEAETGWRQAVQRHGAQALYFRLNVSRAVRAQEHQDLLALHRPPVVVTDETVKVARSGGR